MKTLFLSLFFAPLSLMAQTDTTLLPPLATFRADTLKPIGIREVPYQYYVKGGTHTGFNRIYSYDGIDVDKPAKTLTPTILAIHNPDADREVKALQVSSQKRRTAVTVGIILDVAGFTALLLGGIQESAYKQALNDKIKNYYAIPTYTTPVYATCFNFSGITDSQTGTTTYTCTTDPRIVTTNPSLISYPIVSPPPYRPSTPPTTVDLPNGRGFAVTGLVLVVAGTIVACTGFDRVDHFHRAVQYYNRALSRKISWQLQPYSGVGGSGLTLRGRF